MQWMKTYTSFDKNEGEKKDVTYMIIFSLQCGYLGFSSSFCMSENLILGPFLEHLHFDPIEKKYVFIHI